MMKIMIIGYAATGKATLARQFKQKYDLPIMHMEDIIFDDSDNKRKKEVVQKEVKTFLNNNDSWVINGNYPSVYFDLRAEQASYILVLQYNRFKCFFNGLRSVKEEHKQADKKTFDWILFKGRNKYRQSKFKHTIKSHPDKVRVFKSQKQLTAYLIKLGIE